MAERYVRAFKRSGLDCREVHQVDACGVRLAPGLAVVPDLNNGLAVLVKAPLTVRRIAGLKLSGGMGGCQDLIGFQTGELRYALIAEVPDPSPAENFSRSVSSCIRASSGMFFFRSRRLPKPRSRAASNERISVSW